MSIECNHNTKVLLTNDEPQSSLFALSNPLFQQLLNDVTAFDLDSIVLLPPDRRPVLRLNVSLTEDVFEDVLKVVKLLASIFELKNLSGGLLASGGTRSKDVRQPDLGVGHFWEGESEKRRGKKIKSRRGRCQGFLWALKLYQLGHNYLASIHSNMSPRTTYLLSGSILSPFDKPMSSIRYGMP